MNHPWSIPPCPCANHPLAPAEDWDTGLGVPGDHERPSLQDQALFDCTPVIFGH